MGYKYIAVCEYIVATGAEYMRDTAKIVAKGTAWNVSEVLLFRKFVLWWRNLIAFDEFATGGEISRSNGTLYLG